MLLKWSNPDLIRFEVVVTRRGLQKIETETTTYLFPRWLLKAASSSVADEQLLKTASSSVADEQPGK